MQPLGEGSKGVHTEVWKGYDRMAAIWRVLQYFGDGIQ